MFKHLKLKWVLIKAAKIQYAYTKADTAKQVTFLESAIKLHPRTGYCGTESFLKEVVLVLKHLKDVNPHLIYVCDPVMGDQEKFYVPEALLPIYRDSLVPLADIITPNQFEAELLSGIKIVTEKDAFKAMCKLHSLGPRIVIITSLYLEKPSKLIVMASSRKVPSNEYVRFEVDKHDAVFTGTGDLFASLLLAWLHKFPDNIKVAIERALSTVQLVLEKTLEHANSPDSFRYGASLAARMELRLVQNLGIILNPPEVYKGEFVLISD